MSENNTTVISVEENRKRKRKALLAGGLVLGLGAAVTLAAWSDDVFAFGTFDTGTFDLVGSLDGNTWNDYPSSTEAAQLAFELDASQLAPDQVVYAPFSIATSATDSTLPGEFTLQAVTAEGGLSGVLNYQIYAMSSMDGGTHGAGCSPDSAPPTGTVWVENGPVTTVGTGGTTARPVGASGAAPVQHLCFVVTMAGQTEVETAITNANTAGTPTATTVTWQFNGKSTTA